MFKGFAPAGVMAALALAGALRADPLSRKTEIDFYRDVPSRDLKGLATRSDGRLVAGPQYTDLTGAAPADILWCIVADGKDSWLVGTGPSGGISSVSIDAAKGTYSSRPVAKVDDAQVFALGRFSGGAILAGTSPRGGLNLIENGKIVSRIGLPADSVLDIAVVDGQTALVATGNPGRIYSVNLPLFEKAGVSADRQTDLSGLEKKGVTLFGEIRDRNVRRLVIASDGSVIAGSSPKGNLYQFPAKGGAPFILQENRDAEITDLLAVKDGFYASIVFAGGLGEVRLNTPAHDPKAPPADTPPPAQVERFAGRGTVVWFPNNGFPETIAARPGLAFYRLALHGQTLLIGGGEQGDITGVDLLSRKGLTYPGSVSSQVNGLAPVPGADGRFLAIRNNAPGFGLLDFGSASTRTAQTRRIDLGTPATLGALRFQRLLNVPASSIALSISTSNASDDTEGWSPWTEMTEKDEGWTADLPRGRYVRLKFAVKGSPETAELDKADLYYLPQNHRPTLQDYHTLSANYGIVAAQEPVGSVTTTVAQVLQGSGDGNHHSAFMTSQIVPTPGAQVAFWTVNDLDGDNLVYTFSIRREGDVKWTDVAVRTTENWVQFDTAHLPEGNYFTRLVAEETAPRPKADRLSVQFDTDDLLVDHTPPVILSATARKEGDMLVVSVHGKDALSLLDSIDVTLNNGVHDSTEQPVSGIRDSREGTFEVEIPIAKASGATSAEVTLYDAQDNATTTRVTW